MNNKAEIIYFGKAAIVKCDRNCGKAWGIAARPHRQLSDDEDDIVYLSDGELGEAPLDPGTYEGGFGKPGSPDEFPQKWCVRECERSEISEPGESDVALTDWSKPVYNMPQEHSP